MIHHLPHEACPLPYTYRLGRKEDGQALFDLVSSILISYGLPPSPAGVDRDLFDVESAYDDGYFGVISDANENIVATYGFKPLDEDTIEIRKMYAISSVRGKGLGKWMVSHILHMARKEGYIKAELETSSLLTEAISLYKKLGFVEISFENKTPRCDKSFHMDIESEIK